jgi:hypothetical protein
VCCAGLTPSMFAEHAIKVILYVVNNIIRMKDMD